MNQSWLACFCAPSGEDVQCSAENNNRTSHQNYQHFLFFMLFCSIVIDREYILLVLLLFLTSISLFFPIPLPDCFIIMNIRL